MTDTFMGTIGEWAAHLRSLSRKLEIDDRVAVTLVEDKPGYLQSVYRFEVSRDEQA